MSDDSAARRWDVALAVQLSAYGVAACVLWIVIWQCTGIGGYTLDDTYIHGALAKNLAESGTFGVVPGEFAGASSSPLWTLLLALCFMPLGPQVWIFALMVTVFGALLLERMNALMMVAGVPGAARLVIGLLALIYAPIGPVLSTGMEHTMHAWALVGLLVSLAKMPEKNQTIRDLGGLFLWAAAAAGARYESLFLLPGVCLWLVGVRQWKTLATVMSGMAFPVLLYAAYSLSHGGFALPNSLMLKGDFGSVFQIKVLGLLWDYPHLFVVLCFLVGSLLILLLAGYRQAGRLWWLPAVMLVMLLVHLQLAKLGWFYRYEAYLIVVGLTVSSVAYPVVAAWLGRVSRWRRLCLVPCVVLMVLFLTMPLGWRTQQAMQEIVPVAGNIHDQQRQMAAVVTHLGPGARVAVNDLGAVAFFSRARVLDLWGLGDNAMARAKCEGRYDAGTLCKRLEESGTEYVICYPSWFLDGQQLPESLIAVEEWILGKNHFCGSDRVVFYGVTPAAAERLRDALAAYRRSEPDAPFPNNRMIPLAPPSR